MRIISGVSAPDAEPSREKQCPNPIWGDQDSKHASNPQHFVQDISPAAFCRVYLGLPSFTKGWNLKPFQSLENHLLVTLDGTQYYSSLTLHCKNCSSRTHKTGAVTYSHGAILPVIVAPGQSQVISLAPEFITPQDGHEKQDCEIAAAKRWVSSHTHDFMAQKVTLLGDDLYSHQPMCEHALDGGMNFIFTCLPDSHPALYDWLTYLDGIGEVHTLEVRQRNKRVQEIYRYRFVNEIPLSTASWLIRVVAL